MITIQNKKQYIENANENILFFPDIFKGKIINTVSKNPNRHSILSLTVGLAIVTGKVYKTKENNGSQVCIILEDKQTVSITNKKSIQSIQSIQCNAGSVFILGNVFRKQWCYTFPKSCIFLYEENYLPDVFISIKNRIQYSKKISKILHNLKILPEWTQSPKNLFNMNLIGKGCYGNIFESGYHSKKFAFKMTKIKLESIYNTSFSCWHEVFFLENIFKPLITKKICPNIPLIYNSFTSNNCDLILDDKKLTSPAIITAIELANGNLKNFLQKNRKIEELYSCLFQIMAGLYTIQHYAQLMNFDIKKENILYYNITEGGYWCYIIRGKKYYVPNYGKLFIVNDFGISRIMSPKYQLYKNKEQKTFRLGSRYAIVQNNKFIPVHTINQIDENGSESKAEKIKWPKSISYGSEFRLDRKNGQIIQLKLSKKSQITFSYDFFEMSDIFPPFEFYNDTQDAIRMFIGGKRTTQKGHHKVYSKLPLKFIEQLSEYVGKGESMKNRIFSDEPSQVLACYFIESFFEKYTNYLIKPEEKIIETYIISI